MNDAGQALIRDYVDAALAFLAAQDLMREPSPFVAAAMRDDSRPATAGGTAWQPIASTVTAADIAELERAIGHTLPPLYVAFLKYLHFYTLDDAAGVSFIMHDIREWKNSLLDHYFYLQKPGSLTEQGYVQFAYDGALNPICFDLNQRASDGLDCAVVLITDTYQHPAPAQLLYPSFRALLLGLRAAQRRRDSAPA